MIFLKQYDTETIYQLDTNTCELKEIKQDYVTIHGFVSFVKCGLKKRDITAESISIFCIKSYVYLCINRNIYDANLVEIGDFSIFVRSMYIRHRGKIVFFCKQWTRDIDDFYMDDFFYFLKYSKNHNYENILTLCHDKWK